MKKRAETPANSDRWLMPYAGFMTVLFAFFVILFAISQADLNRFRQVAESLRESLKGEPPANADKNAHPVAGGEGDGEGLQASVKQQIEESLALESGLAGAGEKIQAIEDDRGLIVRLSAKDFFDEGAVEIHPDLRPLLDRIGRVLAKTQNQIRIEAHTDLGEEGLSRVYPSGWELSAARAAWVVGYWAGRQEIEPARLSAVGYSHFRPLSEKQDEWSRGKNRRIEIVLVKGK